MCKNYLTETKNVEVKISVNNICLVGLAILYVYYFQIRLMIDLQF